MSKRISYDVVCPNGHNVAVKYSKEEFEESLANGVLEFVCNTCDTRWPPTHAEIEDARKRFAEEESDAPA